jgi:SAM-dependent methyltransferase
MEGLFFSDCGPYPDFQNAFGGLMSRRIDRLKNSLAKRVAARLLPEVEQRLRAAVDVNALGQASSLLEQLAQTQSNSRVGINALKQLSPEQLNLKQYGLTLGRAFADQIAKVPCKEPAREALGWRPSTQADLESEWFVWWCQELNLAPIAHRKLWEFAWLLQNLHARDMLRDGVRGVGFGCGEEPLPSYLAAKGMELVVTDLAPDREEAKAWADSGQHGTNAAMMFDEALIDRDTFNKRVSHRYVDMNDIPTDIRGYDFCWSVCALEHLGSIEAGLKFVENSIDTLRPGGIALHTTEFNFLSNGETLEEGVTVLFRRSDFEDLAERLRARGCKVDPISFDVGDKPIDRYIDIPPYHFHEDVNLPVFEPLQATQPVQVRKFFDSPPAHMKLFVERFPSTCFGLAVTAPE